MSHGIISAVTTRRGVLLQLWENSKRIKDLSLDGRAIVLAGILVLAGISSVVLGIIQLSGFDFLYSLGFLGAAVAVVLVWRYVDRI